MCLRETRRFDNIRILNTCQNCPRRYPRKNFPGYLRGYFHCQLLEQLPRKTPDKFPGDSGGVRGYFENLIPKTTPDDPGNFRGFPWIAHPRIYSILSISGTLKGPNKSVLLSGRPNYPNFLVSRIFIERKKNTLQRKKEHE